MPVIELIAPLSKVSSIDAGTQNCIAQPTKVP